MHADQIHRNDANFGYVLRSVERPVSVRVCHMLKLELDRPEVLAVALFRPDTALQCNRSSCYCSVHYHRIPVPYWRDRLLRVRSMGLNTIEVKHS